MCVSLAAVIDCVPLAPAVLEVISLDVEAEAVGVAEALVAAEAAGLAVSLVTLSA